MAGGDQKTIPSHPLEAATDLSEVVMAAPELLKILKEGAWDAIRLHDKILLCCSETSLNSWWVKDEIRKAQERECRENRDIIIPLMVYRYLLDGWEDGLAADLRSRLAADFTGWEHDNAKFEEQFEKVVRALRADEGAREKPPESK